jgi:hypothetical protein
VIMYLIYYEANAIIIVVFLFLIYYY